MLPGLRRLPTVVPRALQPPGRTEVHVWRQEVSAGLDRPALREQVRSRYVALDAHDLWFSVSHCDGIRVCAVTGAGPGFGVEIARRDGGDDSLEVASQLFSPLEVDALAWVPPGSRAEAFVRHGALKESLAKAMECSKDEVAQGVAFDVSNPEAIDATFVDQALGQARDWRFALADLDEERIIAVALHDVTDRRPRTLTISLAHL